MHSLVTPHTPNKKYWVGHIGPGTLTRPHARERERGGSAFPLSVLKKRDCRMRDAGVVFVSRFWFMVEIKPLPKPMKESCTSQMLNGHAPSRKSHSQSSTQSSFPILHRRAQRALCSTNQLSPHSEGVCSEHVNTSPWSAVQTARRGTIHQPSSYVFHQCSPQLPMLRLVHEAETHKNDAGVLLFVVMWGQPESAQTSPGSSVHD